MKATYVFFSLALPLTSSTWFSALSLLFRQEVEMDLEENSNTPESKELPGTGILGPQGMKSAAVTQQPLHTWTLYTDMDKNRTLAPLSV